MRIGRIEATSGFFLLVAWLNYLDRQNLVLLTFLACFFHECGHYAAMRAIGKNVRLIRLTAVGVQMYIEQPLSYVQECFVAVAGPMVNILLAYIAYHWPEQELFAGLNVSLACFNLLPIGQLDGSRILNSVLSCLISPLLAGNIVQTVGRCLCILVLGFGFVLGCGSGNFSLAFVGTWLCVQTFSSSVLKNSTERIKIGGCQKGEKQVK